MAEGATEKAATLLNSNGAKAVAAAPHPRCVVASGTRDGPSLWSHLTGHAEQLIMLVPGDQNGAGVRASVLARLWGLKALICFYEYARSHGCILMVSTSMS
jgi:hypothetical protein